MTTGIASINSVDITRSFLRYCGTVTQSSTTNLVFMNLTLPTSTEVDGTVGGTAGIQLVDGYFQVIELSIPAAIIPRVDSGGSGRKKKNGLSQGDVSDLLEQYREAYKEEINLKEEKAIISAVEPFIKQSFNQHNNFSNAGFMLNALPKPENIDFQSLSKNSKSLKRLESSLEKFRQLREEENLALFLLLAS